MKVGDIIEDGWKIIFIDYHVNDMVVEKDGIQKIVLIKG